MPFVLLSLSLLSVELDPSVSNIDVNGECTTHCLRCTYVLDLFCCAPAPHGLLLHDVHARGYMHTNGAH